MSINNKDIWSSKAIENLTDLHTNRNEISSRSDMIHKINLIDESITIYGKRLENVHSLSDKIAHRIINSEKRRVNQNTTVNTLAKEKDLTLEFQKKVFFDEKLKKWNSKGDSILRNVFLDADVKINIHNEKLNKKVFSCNIELNQNLSERLNNLNFSNLHICPSLSGIKNDEVTEQINDEFYDDMIVVNEDHIIENFNDQFNELNIEDEKKEIREMKNEIVELDPTPFTYHKAWAGPSHWKISNVKKKFKINKEKKKKKFQLFELNDKNIITLDRRSTLPSREEIVQRRTESRNLKKDYGLRVEDLYTACKITNIDCFLEKKVRVEEQKENTNHDITINNTINDMSIKEPNLDVMPLLVHPKPSRRIPMDVLHQKINEILENNKKMNQKVSLKMIFKNLQNVTWQYMVVGILEMMNMGIRIENQNGENLVVCD